MQLSTSTQPNKFPFFFMIMSQGEIYTRLRQHGSTWLKSHVLYADRQLVVLNKPPGLICQINNSQDGNGIVGISFVTLVAFY